MSFDAATIAKFAPRPKEARRVGIYDDYVSTMVEHGEELFAEFGVDTALELQHFMAQIAHESGGFTIFRENMNYRAERIIEIFGVGKHSARITPEEAAQLAGNPDALAERVYGLGNPRKAAELGNIEFGDGARFVGMGLIQVTGRTDHEKFYGGDYSPRQCLKAALMEWDEKGCSELAADDNCKLITKKINGGYNGLSDRQQWLAKAKKIWPVFPFESEARKEEVKPAIQSTTVQAGGVTTVASVYSMQAEVKREVAAASTEHGFAWGKFVLSLMTSEVFLASLIAVAGAVYVVLHRKGKADIDKWFRRG